MNDIKIGICYYMPEDSYIENDICLPIQLGYHETKIDLGIIKDSTGDNRALKHPFYSEYSGIYWIWKNVNAGYKGMFHHRRAFTLENIGIKEKTKYIGRLVFNYAKNLIKHIPYSYNERIVCHDSSSYMEKLNSFCNILPGILNGNDIIVPKPYSFCHISVVEFFDEVVNRVLLEKLKKIIKINYPTYYEFFIKTLNGSNLYYGNLQIMRSNLFDEYCTFVFGVFDNLESELIGKGYYLDLSQEKVIYRVFGYIGELLTNTYIIKKKSEKIKIKECTLLFNASVKGNENISLDKISLK